MRALIMYTTLNRHVYNALSIFVVFTQLHGKMVPLIIDLIFAVDFFNKLFDYI